jgi:hypothetical protein
MDGMLPPVFQAHPVLEAQNVWGAEFFFDELPMTLPGSGLRVQVSNRNAAGFLLTELLDPHHILPDGLTQWGDLTADRGAPVFCVHFIQHTDFQCLLLAADVQYEHAQVREPQL